MSEIIRSPTRSHRSRAQWQRLLDAQATSGLSQQAYCAQHHIAYSSFCRWKRELASVERNVRPTGSSPFVELTVPAAAAESRWEVELEFGNGVFLRLRHG
jgi:hypothetical protein